VAAQRPSKGDGPDRILRGSLRSHLRMTVLKVRNRQ
jgi:hypothetical protein